MAPLGGRGRRRCQRLPGSRPRFFPAGPCPPAAAQRHRLTRRLPCEAALRGQGGASALWAALEGFPRQAAAVQRLRAQARGVGPLGAHRDSPRQQPGRGGVGPLGAHREPPCPAAPGCGAHRRSVATRPMGLPARLPPPRRGSRPPHPPHHRQEAGPVRGLCQVLFILFPQKHLVRGQLLGGSHDTAVGVVRHGTARYSTVRGHYGWHRAQQTRTPSQCSEGAHLASRLLLATAPAALGPSSLHPLSPRPGQQIATIQAGDLAWQGGLRTSSPSRHGGELVDVLGQQDGPWQGSPSCV